jgi:hypothetical protein
MTIASPMATKPASFSDRAAMFAKLSGICFERHGCLLRPFHDEDPRCLTSLSSGINAHGKGSLCQVGGGNPSPGG